MKRAIKNILKQLELYNKDPIPGLSFEQVPNDAMTLNFTLIGPSDCAWEGCLMNGTITFPEKYPFEPPVLKFITKTFHPNIYTNGKVCLSILNANRDETGYFQASELWSPVLDIKTVFICITNLFVEPNLESPADLDAAIEFRKDNKKYTKKIRSMFKM